MAKKDSSQTLWARLLEENAHGRGCNATMIVVEEEEDNLIAGEKTAVAGTVARSSVDAVSTTQAEIIKRKKSTTLLSMARGATSAHEHRMHSISAVHLS